MCVCVCVCVTDQRSQEGTLKDSDARAAYFEEQLTPHRQDLVLIAEVDPNP